MATNIGRINTAAIKGTALSQPQRVLVERAGVHENRRFHFIDARGLMINGKRAAELVCLHTEFDRRDDALSLRFPDGSVIREQVRPADETVTTDFYGRPVSGVVVDGPWAAAVSEFIGTELRLVRIAPDVTGTDVHPVTLISNATMEHVRLNSAGPASRWPDRFRMLFEIDGLDAYEEETWTNRSVRVGDALLRVIGAVPRCVVTTHDPATGAGNHDTLRSLRIARLEHDRTRGIEPAIQGGKILVGMYATVDEPGEVWVGCEARPI